VSPISAAEIKRAAGLAQQACELSRVLIKLRSTKNFIITNYDTTTNYFSKHCSSPVDLEQAGAKRETI
jgi:hypothetical protein